MGPPSFGDDDRLGLRVYQALKAHVLSEDVVSGERLDLARLADRHRASLTPVRAALHRLSGEGLVEAFPHEGFRVPFVTEAGLRDLYDWNDRLAALALPPASRRDLAPPLAAAPDDIPLAADALFEAVATLAGNLAVLDAVRRLNAQLARARLKERRLMRGLEPEALELSSRLRSGHWAQLRRALHAYHQRRIRRVCDLVQALAARLAS